MLFLVSTPFGVPHLCGLKETRIPRIALEILYPNSCALVSGADGIGDTEGKSRDGKRRASREASEFQIRVSQRLRVTLFGVPPRKEEASTRALRGLHAVPHLCGPMQRATPSRLKAGLETA